MGPNGYRNACLILSCGRRRSKLEKLTSFRNPITWREMDHFYGAIVRSTNTVLHFHRLNHHERFASAYRLPYFRHHRSDDARQRRCEPTLRSSAREFFQARVFEHDLPVITGDPEMEVCVDPEIAGLQTHLFDADRDESAGK